MLNKIFEALGADKVFLSAVILAGGSGSRFGSDKPKQFTEINGKPVSFDKAQVAQVRLRVEF